MWPEDVERLEDSFVFHRQEVRIHRHQEVGESRIVGRRSYVDQFGESWRMDRGRMCLLCEERKLCYIEY